MTTNTALTLPFPTREAPLVEKKPWERRDGEKTLWYNRFLKYRELGTKRTLQAAVLSERQSIKALKSPKKGRDTNTSTGQKKNLEVSVPGSWKHACSEGQWVKRAQAWDLWRTEQLALSGYQSFLSQGYAAKSARVGELHAMAQVLVNRFHTANYPQDQIALSVRIQSILKDIRIEMDGVNQKREILVETMDATARLDDQSYYLLAQARKENHAE